MRPILALCLSLAFASAAMAEDPVTACNSICPVSGHHIDPSIPTITAKDQAGKEVHIGACERECAAKIKADPAKYVAAAEADKKL